jgi:small subunit ribosomal protein S3
MTATDAASSIISLLIDEVRQSLEPKILHILADYQTYKETHDAVLQIPFVKHLLENQCRCRHPLPDAAQAAEAINVQVNDDQIHLEIIDVAAHGLPNLDSIAEYINSTIDKDDKVSSEAEEAEAEAEDSEEEEEEEAEDSEEEEAVSEAEEAVSEAEEAVSEAEEAVSEAEEAVSEAEEAVSEAEEAEAEAEESEAQEVTNESAEAEAEAEVVAQKKAPGAAETSEAAISEAAISEAAISEAAISEAAEDDEEELELFEVEIKGKTYVTNDEIEGDIYEYANDEVGEIVGTFKNGVAKFAKKPKAQKK